MYKAFDFVQVLPRLLGTDMIGGGLGGLIKDGSILQVKYLESLERG